MKNFLPGKTVFSTVIASLLLAGPAMAQSMDPGQSHGNPLVAGAFGLFELALIVLVIIGMWKLFTKAGEPGWASIIPIYNIYIICKIVGKPGWWVLLMCIPFI